MSDTNKNSSEEYKAHPLLRREAGEGWHPNGLNTRVLQAIVDREVSVDGAEWHDEAAEERYFEQTALVGELKREAGIGDPPIEPSSDTPSTTE